MTHTGDDTIQDMIDFIGEEPSDWSGTKSPPWIEHVVQRTIFGGESYRLGADLEAGIHTLIRASFSPILVWFGTGLTVEE